MFDDLFERLTSRYLTAMFLATRLSGSIWRQQLPPYS